MLLSWPNINCFQTLQSKAASTAENLQFMSCEKPCALDPKSKYYSQIINTQVLWKVGRSEHGVIPSKLMQRGWKYP